MDIFYLGIVIFIIVLAVFDLIVGVSNDAVNFLNSAIGAKVARFRTIIAIAAVGVFAGAALSNGMMDVARHGIITPQYFSFRRIFRIVVLDHVLFPFKVLRPSSRSSRAIVQVPLCSRTNL